jgi:hypothetical protein
VRRRLAVFSSLISLRRSHVENSRPQSRISARRGAEAFSNLNAYGTGAYNVTAARAQIFFDLSYFDLGGHSAVTVFRR